MATPERFLPKKKLSSFLSAISSLRKAHEKNNEVIRTEVDSNWYILYCKDSEHYYAVQKDGASTITSGKSCIRPAYRVNPDTRRFDYQELADEPGTRHYKFAVKEYTSAASLEEAIIEVNTFELLQFVEPIVTKDGKPTVVSVYFAGKPLTDLSGNTTSLLSSASFIDRLSLITKIMQQYLTLHTSDEQPRLHIDVKGQNIIINVGNDTEPQGRLIDFGSVLRMENQPKPVDTKISGMTNYAIAPEAIAKIDEGISYISAGDISGSATTKSDIYNLVAVFASILGESAPYANRHCTINDIPGSFNIAAIRQSIANGFKLDGLFSFSKKLDFHLPDETTIYFFRKIAELAPVKDKVLEAADGRSGYFQYANYLLYVENGNVYGYHQKIRNLAGKAAAIEANEDLKIDRLSGLDELSGYRRKNTGLALQYILEQEIRSFLETMEMEDPEKRPDTKETFCFFDTIRRIAYLAEQGNDPENPDKTLNAEQVTKAIKLLLSKIKLINFGLGEQPIIPYSTPITDDTKFFTILDYNFFNLIYDDNFSTHYQLLDDYVNALITYLDTDVGSDDEILSQPEWPSALTFSLPDEVRALNFFSTVSAEKIDGVRQTFADWRSAKSPAEYQQALQALSLFNSAKQAISRAPAVAASSSSQP